LTAGWNAGAAVVDTVDRADDNIQLVPVHLSENHKEGKSGNILEVQEWAVGMIPAGAVQLLQASG